MFMWLIPRAFSSDTYIVLIYLSNSQHSSIIYTILSSITCPTKPLITFEEYVTSLDPVPLGRNPAVKTNTKTLSASVAMSEEFPLDVNVLVNILEVLAPTKHMYKLKQFCQSKLPPGFIIRFSCSFLTFRFPVSFQRLSSSFPLH